MTIVKIQIEAKLNTMVSVAFMLVASSCQRSSFCDAELLDIDEVDAAVAAECETAIGATTKGHQVHF